MYVFVYYKLVQVDPIVFKITVTFPQGYHNLYFKQLSLNALSPCHYLSSINIPLLILLALCRL